MKKIWICLFVITLFISSVGTIPQSHQAGITNVGDSRSAIHLEQGLNTIDGQSFFSNLNDAVSDNENDTRIVIPTLDHNGNKISDVFESRIFNLTNNAMVDVIVALNHAPNQNDVSTFEHYGGIVFETWDEVVYAFHGKLPQGNVVKYSLEDEVVLIEENNEMTSCLDYSVKQMRVRPTVWDTYGYSGDSSQAIAILDTGIDDSHPDLAGKIVKWKDFTYLGYISPIDIGEHGTHCAGIAAGTGTTSGASTKKYTWSDWFNWYNEAPMMTNVTPTKSGVLSLTLQWDDDYNDGFGQALIWIDTNQNGVMDAGEYVTGNQTLTYSASVNAGRYIVGVNALDWEASLEDFFCQMNVPSQSLGDGHNLLTGVAPNCKLAGLKVLDDTGSSPYSVIINGINWLATNAQSYNIIVASMSLGGPHSDAVDIAVNNLVSAGVVCVVAAGNSQETAYVGSPGTAAEVITVGAVNDDNQLTSFSSIGDPGRTPLKPDVLAPGGSFYTGDEIISVDSNNADNTYTVNPDWYPNDYRAMLGTSMACPHVAGLAALLADAQGTWQYTAEQALRVKQLICMTSYEIGSAENPLYNPPFNHGGKDTKEGYGRVSGDAAIEAATMTIGPGNNSFSFGSQASDKKVWARQVIFQAGSNYTFLLDVPSTGNYDLYLYDPAPDANGEPVLIAASYASGHTDEGLTYQALETGTFFIVAKWRSGDGQATLTFEGSSSNQPPVFGTPTPTNGSINRPTTLTWKIPLNDPNGDTFDFTIHCSNGQTKTKTGATNGTKSLTLSGLAYLTTYKVWVNATDPGGSGLYTWRWYTFTTQSATNHPPNQPKKPTGPTTRLIGQAGTYWANGTDPDGDKIQYRFDWNASGAHSYSGWTSLVNSGQKLSKNHSWTVAGTFIVKVQSRDEYGVTSTWSNGLNVTVANHAPNKPKIPTGPTTRVIGQAGTYYANGTDPDNDQIQYRFDWNASGSHSYSAWTSLVNSGQKLSKVHSWTVAGTYVVKVQSRDEHGATSVWSTGLTVVVSA
jgi:subtilisin family serine protease